MNFVGKFFLPAALLFISIVSTSCQDTKTITDTNQEISSRNWSYNKKVPIPVNIQDETIPYNIYINLRHTADYKYSNIFLLIRVTEPDGRTTTERKEFKLAYPDGEWLGKGSGNMYSYQLPYKMNYRFAKKGIYTFQLEQNMRDNPLHEITDAGIRVEKAE
jgi:gliding motility-associated lipoprotein GldH